jgi:CheY-like chemotaxis protein
VARVLVVNDDPWTQRVVSAVLVQAGHTVDLATEGWEALLHAGRLRPDLVITDLEIAVKDGRSFVDALRARPDTSGVPAIFLTRNGHVPDWPHPHLDHFLSRQFRVEELEELLGVLLGVATPAPIVDPTKRPTGSTPLPPPLVAPSPRHDDGQAVAAAERDLLDAGDGARRTVLHGLLTEFALSSLLIVLELERKTGVLLLHDPNGSGGRVSLRQGRVVRAEAPGGVRGALAVYEMLTWTQGRFEFQAAEVGEPDEVGSSTSFLLMEGARLVDERNHQGRN